MMSRTFLSNLQTNYSKLDKIQQQLSSGNKFSKPSENPVGTVRTMFYKSTLNEIEQYRSNASAATGWMQSSDDALDQVSQVLQRVRELTVKAGNDTNDPTALQAISDEINQLAGQLGDVANSEIGGRYIFAGTDTQTAPYDKTVVPPPLITSGNNNPINYQIGAGSTVQINVTGQQVFNQGSGVFQLLKNITEDITNGINPANRLSEIDAQFNNVITVRAEIGARMNRMDLNGSRLEGLEYSTTELLANTIDVDVAQAYTELSEQNSVYTAALSVGARIIQPTLVDFLR
jgi:flagellar hook-associated protein 3 FlgL